MKQSNLIVLSVLLLLANVTIAQNIEDTAFVKILGIKHFNSLGLLVNNEVRLLPANENLRSIPTRNGGTQIFTDTRNEIYRRFLVVDENDIASKEMLNEDSIRSLIFQNKAYMSCHLSMPMLNYILASPQCDSSLAARLMESYEFNGTGWYHFPIFPKYEAASSGPIPLNKSHSYIPYNESDYFLVETTYYHYCGFQPLAEFEGFVLDSWLSSKDNERVIRVAFPLFK